MDKNHNTLEDHSHHYDYNPIEKAKKCKTKIEEALDECDESFIRLDFYRLLKESYRLLSREITEQTRDYDYAE